MTPIKAKASSKEEFKGMIRVTVPATVREADGDGLGLSVTGEAIVFDQKELIGSRDWGFVEWIEQGAADGREDDDVRFLFNHTGVPLARTTNGSLALTNTKTGVRSDADLADVQLSRDLMVLIDRGDINQMSFAFDVADDRIGQFEDDDDEFPGMPFRAITKLERLYDVSAVTFPAYEGTSLQVARSKDDIGRVLEEMRSIGVYDTPNTRDRLERFLALGDSMVYYP